MQLISSVPNLQFTQAGLIIPPETDVLAGVQSDIDTAFGGGLNPALETPQGQLASSQAAIIGDKNNEIAYITNQIDPQFSEGRFQDAIGRIYFLTRKPATSTAVQCTLSGVAGTVIPAGTFAQDTSGNTYVNSGTVTIGLAGTVTAEFQNVAAGPLPCAATTLTSVYQAIPGWDAISNPVDGVLGSLVETRSEFETRRVNSVAINGHGSLNSIYANVFNLPNVIDVYAIENTAKTVVNTGVTNYPMAPNSMYVAVVGGVDLDIADAIWNKKDLGCNYNGNTSVTVTDNSGYSYPQPTYLVKFNRPAALPIKFLVQLVNNPALPSNIVDLVRAVVIARFNGVDGTARERIGARILSSRYYGSITAISPTVALLEVLLGSVTATLSQEQIGIDKQPTVTSTDIAVVLV